MSPVAAAPAAQANRKATSGGCPSSRASVNAAVNVSPAPVAQGVIVLSQCGKSDMFPVRTGVFEQCP